MKEVRVKTSLFFFITYLSAYIFEVLKTEGGR